MDQIRLEQHVLQPAYSPGSSGKLLVGDIYTAQQTRAKTCLVNVPNGLTAYVQVLDVGVNRPFKDDIYVNNQKGIYMLI